jgi:branched-chain amino acid transport system ATP-binding protein
MTPTSATSELVVEHLSLRFGGLTVLDDVSLQVARGELLALIGPNGAGKTSVLNCISGIYRGQGAIRLRGVEIGGKPSYQIAQLGIARTFQHGEVFPHMTVLENLLTGRHARISTNMLAEMFFLPGVRRQELEHREAVDKIMRFFGLTPQRHTLVGELPFGRQKLVGVARALAIDPVLLLLDEPSAGLNRNEREDLARFIIRIKAELGLPMIWIEHDMQMVADLADRLHVLDYGKTLAIGSAQEVLRDPAVVQAYLGTHGVALHEAS